jgi:hypothetical protein
MATKSKKNATPFVKNTQISKKARKKKQPDPKEIDPATGLRKRSLKGYGNIRPAEVSRAIVETRQEAQQKGIRVVEICPVDIRRDVLAAVANKIKPQRIADALDTLLSATKIDLLGQETPDYRAIHSGVKIYGEIMQIIGVKLPEGEEEKTPTSQAEEELMKRLAESKGAFSLLQKALERVQTTHTTKIIDAVILPEQQK